MSTRLNKLLSSRGIGARRKCDAIIAEGRVRVNGRVVTEPGTQVEEQRDRVEVDGRTLAGAQKLSYFVLNKPVGVITTMDDPQGRRTIAELLPRGQRLFPVGRLDADTSGLLFLTNDGELAHKLMHPRYGVDKVYRVRLDHEPSKHQLDRLARGVEFEPGVTSAPARVRRIDPGFDAIMIEVTIHEGRFRQVRRMCEAVGINVTGLHRVGYGPVRLGPLARGMWRELADSEVERLRETSARPVRRSAGRSGPGALGAKTRPERPARSAPPAAARRAPEPRDEDEIEDNWIAGGGFSPGPEERGGADEWPARAGRGRGDDAFRESGKAKRPDEGAMPWHAPEYRRGAAGAAPAGGAPARASRAQRREEAGPREGARPPRRDERPRRAEFRPPGRVGRAPVSGGRERRETGRPASAQGRPMRRDDRPSGGPPRRDDRASARPPRRDDRASARPPRRDDRAGGRSSRGDERAVTFSGRDVREDARPTRATGKFKGPTRNWRFDARSPAGRAERALSARRDAAAGRGGRSRPARGESSARPARGSGRPGAGPRRGDEPRAFSPRRGASAGPARPAGRRAGTEAPRPRRKGPPESSQRRQRKP